VLDAMDGWDSEEEVNNAASGAEATVESEGEKK
jgi:hypothetical protein